MLDKDHNMIQNEFLFTIFRRGAKKIIRNYDHTYLHEKTNHGISVSKIHNPGVDQMSRSGSSESMKQTPLDETCIKPFEKDNTNSN